jgi:hypothetical protein
MMRVIVSGTTLHKLRVASLRTHWFCRRPSLLDRMRWQIQTGASLVAKNSQEGVTRVRVPAMTPPTPLWRTVACLATAATLLSACATSGGSASSPTGSDRQAVVTTVAPITSIAANIVGDRADVVGIVPEGTNSHTFEPPPQAAARRSAPTSCS